LHVCGVWISALAISFIKWKRRDGRQVEQSLVFAPFIHTLVPDIDMSLLVEPPELDIDTYTHTRTEERFRPADPFIRRVSLCHYRACWDILVYHRDFIRGPAMERQIFAVGLRHCDTRACGGSLVHSSHID
jgi:hypothetical protein